MATTNEPAASLPRMGTEAFSPARRSDPVTSQEVPGGVVHTLPVDLREALTANTRVCAERNVALFFGHATHSEIYQLAEEVEKVGLKRAVIDHPFSPFLSVSPEMMKELSKVGIFFNFTWDELSPLLGVDPQIMYNTIREVGPEHFTLSSDAGEPLFPDSVEAMRLVRGYMEAFGLDQDELYTVCTKNPAKVVGLALG